MRNPVLLIHGLDDTAVLFRRMGEFLTGYGFEVHRLSLIPSNGDAGLDLLASQVAAYVDGRRMDLVGFSMGGVVARYYVQRLGGLANVERLVTISSPHRGTWTGFLRRNAGARQMRPGSMFLNDLNRDVESLNQISFTSIWTPLDLMIVPASSSVLPAGRSIRVNVPCHPWMVTDRRVLSLVQQLLTAIRQS